MTRNFFACAAAAAITACSAAPELGQGIAALSPDEEALAAAVLEFANFGNPHDLDTVLNVNAAQSIKASRPFASLSALAAATYVGDSALNALLGHVAPDAAAAGAGFWEEVLLSARQAGATLDMANLLELEALGCDIGLTSAMTARVVAARPIADLTTLVNVPYFGASHLKKFKDAVDWYATADAAATRYDCVSFTAAQADAALRLANEGGFGQLCGAAGCGFSWWEAKVRQLYFHRPWASLETIAATVGFGPAAMGALRARADLVISGAMTVGLDSVQRVLAGEIDSEYVKLQGLQYLGAFNIDQRYYVYGTGYALSNCQTIADAGDATPLDDGHHALLCTGGCSPETRWFFHQSLGTVFYVGSSCSFD